MTRLLLAPLLLLALALPVRAGEEVAGDGWIDLEGETVLASPGLPEAVHDLLPGGHAPGPLTWPLPPGPLLVLGLPYADETADDLARLWNLLPGNGDLHGGYVIHAWHDGTRPIAAIFAEDGVALRHALARTASARRIRMGRHVERPRFRTRALAWADDLDEGVELSIQGYANRIWLRPHRYSPPMLHRATERLKRHGIEPVLDVRDLGETRWTTPELLAAFRKNAGIRHLSLAFVRAEGARPAQTALRSLYGALCAAAPVDELYGDSLTLGVPTAIAVPSRRSHSGHDAFLFRDGWCSYVETPVPSRPRNQPDGIGEKAAGILVFGRLGVEAVLEDAWTRAPGSRDAWEDVLLPLFTRRPMTGANLLIDLAHRIRFDRTSPPGARRWLRRLAAQIGEEELTQRETLVPRVPAHVEVDGRIDEAAWAYAAVVTIPTGRLLLVADGRRLFLAVETRETSGVLVARAHPPRYLYDALTAPHRKWIRMRADGTRVLEAAFDRHALKGDAHPGRLIRLEVTVGSHRTGRTVLDVVLGP